MKDFQFQQKEEFDIFENTTLNCLNHIHGHIEIVAVRSGTADFCIGEENYKLRAGDISIVFPNQIHSYKNSKNVDVVVIIFSPESLHIYGELFYSKLPSHPIIRGNNEDLFNLINLFYPKYYKNTSREIIIGYVQAIVGMIISRLSFKKKPKDNESTATRLLQFCNEHYMEPISIRNVSRSLNISLSMVTYIFKNHLHTTFTDYIQKKRVAYACDIFKSGICNVTEAAFASGFNSVRSFERVFLKYKGISPKHYAAAARNETAVRMQGDKVLPSPEKKKR